MVMSKDMNERSLILKAIKQKDDTPKEEIDFDFPEPDVIDKYVKRKKRMESWKQKTTEDWNNSDFLNYFDSMLKEFGVRRNKGNLRSDSNTLNRIHDSFVKYLKEKMNNAVLKSYMDWWCSIWAPRLTGSEMHLNYLLQEHLAKRFSSRYIEEDSIKEILPVVAPPTVDDNSIFGLGGINLLVMKRGIVIGYRMLRQRSVSDPAQVIRNTLSSLEKGTLTSVMETTIQFAPYKSEDRVDFVALAKPYLEKHDLANFIEPHERYFRSE